MKLREFLKKIDHDQIKEAIRQAEYQTSGEIRVHIEEKLGKKDPFERAVAVFHKLKMNNTALRNGVLIYIATGEQYVTVIGDAGINELVDENYWEDVIGIITKSFKAGKFTEGICNGILKIGEKLKELFPYQADDVNELPDDISTGDIG
ncbi:MAG: TPM domain-containing protein [Calditrichia bacterium]